MTVTVNDSDTFVCLFAQCDIPLESEEESDRVALPV